jgi:hypothetical protein
MTRSLKCLVVLVLLLVCSPAARAQDGGGGNGQGGNNQGNGGHHGGSTSVPEMSPTSMGSAIGLAGAGTVMLFGRRRKTD